MGWPCEGLGSRGLHAWEASVSLKAFLCSYSLGEADEDDTGAHHLLSEAKSPKPTGLKKTSRLRGPKEGTQAGATRLLPSLLGKEAVGPAGSLP